MKKFIASIFIVFAIFIVANSVEASLSDGLLVYYPFDNSADDVSGNGYNAIIIDAISTEDRFGNANSAYMFDGENSYIENKTFSTNDLSGISVAFWVKTLETEYSMITQTSWGGFYQDSSGRVRWFIDGSSYENSWSDLTINDGLWHLVVGVNDGSTSKLYIDGIFQVSDNECIYDGTGITIGQSHYGTLNFIGIIDDYRIYNRPLSENEINQLATVPIPGAVWLLGSALIGCVGAKIKRRVSEKADAVWF